MSESEAGLKQRRGRVKGTLTRLKNFADSITDSTVLEDIKPRIEKLENLWSEFLEIEDELLLIDGQVSELEEFEKKYFETKSLLLRAIHRRIPENTGNSNADQLNSTMTNFLSQQQSFFQSIDRTHQSSSTRLPKLHIPYFSGEYKEWPSFKDLYEASVHSNGHLSDSQKFQYLKGLLKGNAANLVRHLSITDANYNEAWGQLKRRFDKRYHITTSYIKTFLDQSSIHQASARNLRNLCDTFDEVIRGLKALGNEAEGRDPWLVHIALTKLDQETREAWAKEMAEQQFPTFQQFISFLNKRCDALETCSIVTKKSSQAVKALHATSTFKRLECPKCNLNHSLYQCEQFKLDSPQNRKTLVISKALCFKCFGSNHSVKTCRSKIRCHHCKGSHHPLLHRQESISTTLSGTLPSFEPCPSTSTTNKPPNPTPKTSINHYSLSSINSSQQDPSINSGQEQANPSPLNLDFPQQGQSLATFNACVNDHNLISQESLSDRATMCLLPTALVTIPDRQGKDVLCRILLDSGSQVSLISEACAQKLGLKRNHAKLSITGLSSSRAGTTRGKVVLSISSRFNKSNSIVIEAFVMNKLTSLIPSKYVAISDTKAVCNLQLADPNFNKPSAVDIILGTDYVFDVLLEGKIYNEFGRIISQETLFGWVLVGNFSLSSSSAFNLHSVASDDLDKSLRCFWEIEEVNTRTVSWTKEEEMCEMHFKHHVSRDNSGRYVVALPMKETVVPLGESRVNALKRLHSAERRFQRDPALKFEYVKFMREYESLGHMELIPRTEIDIEPQRCYYLPHHSVFKHSPVPKIRVVFDGSCKTSSGISLNDKLMVGATVQRDLIAILMSFRKHKVAFCADVEKMYRQVLVTPGDRDFQRILWRENTSSPVQEYRLNTVTYGTASAPFLATRVLHEIAETCKSAFPTPSSVMKTDFYIDDLLTGTNSLEEALELRDQLQKILEDSGFHLTKWISNASEFFSGLQENNSSIENMSIGDSSGVTKVLGVQWNPQEDVFCFKLFDPNSNASTKRMILSEASRIFDPMGWLSPVVVSFKILLQKLWLSKFNWDDILPDETIKKWQDMKTQLPSLIDIKIPRRIFCERGGIQFHGFSDASESAYAAVIYCRSIDSAGIVSTTIVAAKTRVSPLKQVSLPRLELCAALLLSQLFQRLITSLSLGDVPIFAWTDSTIVLGWLSDVPRRWKSFVANRTAEILNVIPRSRWSHVSSKDNPADAASRGTQPKDLPDLKLWWNGPQWLDKDSSQWPKSKSFECNIEMKCEERKGNIVTLLQEITDNDFCQLFTRFSSFSKLTRVLGYVLRFIHNAKGPRCSRKSDLLSTEELNEATSNCFKYIQREAFSEEIKELSKGKPISSRSSIANICPFIDKRGLMRVGGRLKNAACSFNAKHPIILPKLHHVTSALILELHKLYLHPGPTLLIGLIRQRYWVIGIRDLVKKISQQCITCFKQRATASSQLMGNFPEARVRLSRPFSKVGIDYAGPIKLCAKMGRGVKAIKGYIVLFVCFVTKAIHLEAASDLTAEAFIAALRRFVSRRGIPSHIFSDNGSNFVGGCKNLKEMHALAISHNKNPLITNFLSQFRITWSFIPPGAPHFGGLWEAGVKSVKWHLRRVIGETLLSLEEITTLLTQIEAILNSRPYGAVSSDPESLDALTPSHFLIGEPLTTLPEADFTEVKISRLGRFQNLQAMVQGFWKRWHREYISSLQERPKWRTKLESLQEGQLVLVAEDHLPPSKWLTGRIIATHPGDDGLVRVVTIRTQHGVCKRAINKVVKLPVS